MALEPGSTSADRLYVPPENANEIIERFTTTERRIYGELIFTAKRGLTLDQLAARLTSAGSTGPMAPGTLSTHLHNMGNKTPFKSPSNIEKLMRLRASQAGASTEGMAF